MDTSKEILDSLTTEELLWLFGSIYKFTSIDELKEKVISNYTKEEIINLITPIE